MEGASQLGCALRVAYAWVLRRSRRAVRVGGPFWIPVWVIPLALLGLFMGSQNYDVLLHHPGWEIYELKLRSPFTNMVEYFEPSSNPAKQTFRITHFLVGHWLGLGRVGMLVMLHLMGLVLVGSAMGAAWQITRDRVTAFFVGLYTICTIAGMMGFAPYFPQFDGICLALLLLTIVVRQPVLVGAFAFMACWCDERGVIACAFPLVYHALRTYLAQSCQTASALGFRAKFFSQARCFFAPPALGVVSAWILYFAGRAWMQLALGMETAVGGLGFTLIKMAKPTYHLGLWVGLEGGWVVVLAALLLLVLHRRLVFAAAFFVAVAVIVVVAFSVGDVSKSMCYLFPAFFPALLYLRQFERTRHLRILVFGVFLVSCLAMNYHIWGWMATKNFYWIYPWPLQD